MAAEPVLLETATYNGSAALSDVLLNQSDNSATEACVQSRGAVNVIDASEFVTPASFVYNSGMD